MSHASVPTVPGWQSTTHFAPFAHSMWHEPPSAQANRQVLFAPHVQTLFAHVPVQLGLFCSHVTRHGGSRQVNAHDEPSPQRHSPSAHAPLQRGFVLSQVTLQGDSPQPNAHDAPELQVQMPFAHVPLQVEPCWHVT
jgi:hypothetical protein